MAYAKSRAAARSHSLFLDLPIAVIAVLLAWASLSMYTTPAVQPLASTLTNEPSSVPAPAPTLKRPHTMVAEAHTAVEQDQKGIVYVRIPGHDKREPIEVDVERPLDDVRDALKSFLPFQFDGNFRLKDSHDVLDASKSLRDLGLDCGVGQYVELEYHHANHFPGLLGGVSKAVMASTIRDSGIDRPSGDLAKMDRATILEPLYAEAQAELAKAKARPRRAATTEQSEETKEEDVEMKDVTHIKLATKEGEVLLKEEVEKLLVEADKAWTCAKIKFHDAFVDLHAIDATPARSMAWWCRSRSCRALAGTATSSPIGHSLVDCTQAGKRLQVKELREALIADKTIEIKAGVRSVNVDTMINKLCVEWAKDYYKRWEVNPKSVEGDAFAALDVEAYIRGEVSWSARQSNFTASAFDSHADASSV